MAMQHKLGGIEARLQFRERHVQTSTHSQALQGLTTSGKLLWVQYRLWWHILHNRCDLLSSIVYHHCNHDNMLPLYSSCALHSLLPTVVCALPTTVCDLQLSVTIDGCTLWMHMHVAIDQSSAQPCAQPVAECDSAGCRTVYGPAVARCLLPFNASRGSGSEEPTALDSGVPCFRAEVRLYPILLQGLH